MQSLAGGAVRPRPGHRDAQGGGGQARGPPAAAAASQASCAPPSVAGPALGMSGGDRSHDAQGGYTVRWLFPGRRRRNDGASMAPGLCCCPAAE